MQVLAEKPLIVILAPTMQRDRLDTRYYSPAFLGVDEQLTDCGHSIQSLSNVMSANASYGVLPPSASYCADGPLLIRSSNISNTGIAYEDAVHIPPEWLSRERARLRKGDVLISVKGARAFQDICVVRDNPPPAIVNGSIFRFQCRTGIDPAFVAIWLLSTPIQSRVLRERTNLGISYISADVLASIPIPDLTPEEQRSVLHGLEVTLEHSKVVRMAVRDIEEARGAAESDLADYYTSALGVPEPAKSATRIRVVAAEEIEDRLDWKAYDPNLITSSEELSAHFSGMIKLQDVAQLRERARERPLQHS